MQYIRRRSQRIAYELWSFRATRKNTLTEGGSTVPEPVVVADYPPVVTQQNAYGPNAVAANVAFTGFTGVLGNGPANTAATVGSVQFNGYSQIDSELAHLFRTPGGRVLRRLFKTLLGVAPGALAQEYRTRIQARQGSFGGTQLIEQVPYVNRNTTAADVTGLNALLDRIVHPSPYPVDVGGNGGGGKLLYKGVG